MKAKGVRRKTKEEAEKGERDKGTNVSPLSPFSRSPSSRARRKTTVAVVGAGRLGSALARALAACGYEIKALVARSVVSARRAAERAGVEAFSLSVGQMERLPPTDILFITTPDDVIAETAERIASLTRERVRGRVALHTSGALSSEVLAPLRARGFRVGSMHPLAAVSDEVSGAESLRRAFYCVEGDARASSVARRIVRDLGGASFSVRTEAKALYHAAAVMTAGHTVALFDTAAELLARCGLSERHARRVLLPLLQSTLDNLTRQPPERALTGTFARGDAATVGRHLDALRREGAREAMLLYALLGERSLRLAARNGLDAERIGEIARTLAEALGVE
jgi:predicted short-subunit dehydrogenase-like oxidoreductase (DUF2520 family)